MESEHTNDLLLLVKGLQRENSVLRRRLHPGGANHSFDKNATLVEQDETCEKHSDTINELEKRITMLQRIIAQNREQLVEFEVVKRRLVGLDSTMLNQRVQLEKLTAENTSLRKANTELRAENANLLEIYEHELRRADLIRDLCIDLDEENKELHISFQQHQSYQGTPDASGDTIGSPPVFLNSSSLPELPSRSNSAPSESFYQDARLRRRDRRILGQLTTRMCRNARRSNVETTPC